MGRYYSIFRDFCEPFIDDPFAFCKAMGFRPTWQQAQALEIVRLESTLPLEERLKRIAIKSGQGPGKSTVTVLIGLWRTLRRPDALTMVTAPTMRQCRDVYLTEARRLLKKAHPILQKIVEVTKTRIKIARSEEWGIWTATSTRPENLQGYHDDNLTFIVDEASGVEAAIIDQIKGTVSNHDSLVVMIGNPNTRDCAFYDCFSIHRNLWHRLTFNAEQSPIVSEQNIRLLREEFGTHSDVYRVRVLGHFPAKDMDTVISAEELEKCCDPKDKHTKALYGQHRQFGIDLARFGGDESVVYRRQGYAIVEQLLAYSKEPQWVIKQSFAMQERAFWKDAETQYVFDVGGLGGGAANVFKDAGKPNVLEFAFNARPSRRMFADKITEAYFYFALLVRKGLVYIPNDKKLKKQLSSRKYKILPNGKIKLEAKQEYKDRHDGEESPDRADACVLAFFDKATARAQIASLRDLDDIIGKKRVVRETKRESA